MSADTYTKPKKRVTRACVVGRDCSPCNNHADRYSHRELGDLSGVDVGRAKSDLQSLRLRSEVSNLAEVLGVAY